tara:strand:- start:22 stop:321 length:300 start_codon:yes stop_codon:yes gene_type:complete
MWFNDQVLFLKNFLLNTSVKIIKEQNKKLPIKNPDPLKKICENKIEIIKHLAGRLFCIIFLLKTKKNKIIRKSKKNIPNSTSPLLKILEPFVLFNHIVP